MTSTPSVDEKTLAEGTSPRQSIETIPEPSGMVTPLEPELIKPSTLRGPADLEAVAGKSEDDPKQSPRSVHGWRWALVLASIYISAFTYGLDTTIAADVQASVIETFHVVEDLSWLGTGFMLGSVATILPIGVLFELVNVKWLFILGVTIFEIGSAVCGAAPTMNALIVGRVLAGVGGSGVYVGALTFMTKLTTETERGAYISALGIFWGIGAVVGPLIGGSFAESSATWRWAFYINLVIAAVSAPVYFLYLPSIQSESQKPLKIRLAAVDWTGVVLNAASWALFVIVLTFAGSTWAWDDGRTIALWVVFGVVLLSYIAQQRFAIFTTKKDRIFPAHLLKSRTQLLLYFGMASASSALFIPIYYIPLYFQFVHGDSAIQAAVRLLPYVVVAMTVNFAAGWFLPRIPHYALLYLVAGVFIVAGSSALYTIDATTPIANVYGYTVLIAIGAGSVIQEGYTLASVKVIKQDHPDDVGHSISLQNVAQIGSGAISLVISGQVFQTYAFRNLSAVLAGKGFSTAEITSAVAGTQSTVFASIDAETTANAVEALTSAMSKVWILIIVAGAVSMVSGILMRWERLF